MQALVTTARGRVPDDHVIRPVSCRHPGRAPPVLTLTPGEHDRRRIRRGNSVGPDGAGVVVKSNICSLACMIRDSRGPSVSTGNIRLDHR